MKTIMIIFILSFFLFLSASNSLTDSLFKELNSREEADQIEIYNLLAEANWYSAPDKTIEYGKIALVLADKYNNKEQKTLALINIGNGHMFTGNFKEALENHLRPALTLAKKLDFKEGIAGGLNSMAACFMNLGNYQQALTTFEESLQILEASEDYVKAAKIKLNIASLYTNWGDFDKALDYYFEALEVFEKRDDKVLLSRSLNNIAVAYHSWGNYNKALEYYERSLELYNEMNDEIGKAIPLNNIGEIYKDQGDYEKALEYYTNALELVSNTENKQSIGVALQGSGEALKGLKNYDLAMDYLLQALENFIMIGFQEGIANCYHDLGDIYRINQQPQIALDYLIQSLDLAQVSNIVDLMKDNYLLLAETYAELGNYEASLTNFKLYSSLKDSIFTEKANTKITELDYKYNTAKKEQEILILKEKNKTQRVLGFFLIIALLLILAILFILIIYYRTKEKANRVLREANIKIQKHENELKKMNSELQEINATKNKFFSIIAHDLKNAFISQRAGSKLLFKDLDQLDDKTVKALASELYNSAENLYKLLQNLLDWSRFQMGGIELNLEDIDLNKFVQDEFQILETLAARKSIKLESEITANTIVKADRNMLNSIFQSLINNSIKFSHPDTKIKISAQSENEFIKITVKDQGVGIKAENLKKLFRVDKNYTTVGTAREKGTGLGLILCKEFVNLHDGEISINSKFGEGTEITFTLPKAN